MTSSTFWELRVVNMTKIVTRSKMPEKISVDHLTPNKRYVRCCYIILCFFQYFFQNKWHYPASPIQEHLVLFIKMWEHPNKLPLSTYEDQGPNEQDGEGETGLAWTPEAILTFNSCELANCLPNGIPSQYSTSNLPDIWTAFQNIQCSFSSSVFCNLFAATLSWSNKNKNISLYKAE